MASLFETLRGTFTMPAAQRLVSEKSAKTVSAPEVVLVPANNIKPVSNAAALLARMTEAHAAKNAARYAELHVTPLASTYDTVRPKG